MEEQMEGSKDGRKKKRPHSNAAAFAAWKARAKVAEQVR